MADGGKPQEDKLVSQLVPDPAQGPPDTVALTGFLGRSPQAAEKGKPAVWRLYQDHNLDSYVEIPEDEILHTQKLPEDQGSIVWVSKSLQLKYTHVQSGQVQAELLGSGPIAQAGVAPSPAAQGAELPVSIATVCSTVACPSVRICVSRIPCPSTTIVCPTHPGACLSATPSECTPCATLSHCTICPTPSALVSHCTYCPPVTVAASNCTACQLPSSTPSHCTICPTESVLPSRCTLCPPPVTSTATCPAQAGPGAVEYIARSVLTIVCRFPSQLELCPSVNPRVCPSFYEGACPPPPKSIIGHCPTDPREIS